MFVHFMMLFAMDVFEFHSVIEDELSMIEHDQKQAVYAETEPRFRPLSPPMFAPTTLPMTSL